LAKELTAERLVDPDEEVRLSTTRRARRLISPKAQREWKKIVGRTNDWFDTAVYGFAIGWFLRNRKRLTTAERWAELLATVHGPAITDDLFEGADPFVKRAKPREDASERRKARREKWKNRT